MSAVSSRYPVNKARQIDIPHIRQVCNRVITFFNDTNPFRNLSLSSTTEEHDIHNNVDPGCTIYIRGEKDGINNKEFIGHVKLVFREENVEYPIKYTNKYQRIRTVICEIPSVLTDEKIAGQMFGFFLIRLAMIISILGGATVLTLDNDTDRPERAVRSRKGIYGLLQPNMRDETEDKQNLTLFSKEYLNAKAERVRYLEPTDIHIVRQNLTRAIKGLLSKEDKEQKFGRNFIWRPDTLDILRHFFNNETIFPKLFQGGKRGKGKSATKKQKKRNHTHKRRKSSITRR